MKLVNPPTDRTDTVLPLPREVCADAWAVDAACSGNPGQMEYQCIDLQTGERVFHYGPILATNNIGEFLAIVHALALLRQRGIVKIIYTDSATARAWVRDAKAKTTLEPTAGTRKALDLVARAEQWIKANRAPGPIPIIKWETRLWGEIPADFGRKKGKK